MIKRTFNSINEYYNYWKLLIEKERKYEEENFKKLIIKSSLNRRVEDGLAMISNNYTKINNSISLLYRFFLKKDYETNIKVGDTVIIYPEKLEKEKSRENIIKQGVLGSIEVKGKLFLDISLQKALPRKWPKKSLVINLFVSEITFKRMLRALKTIKEANSEFPIEKILR